MLTQRPATRGRVVAIYATHFTLSQMAGPVLVSQVADFAAWRFLLCGALFMLALPALAAIRSTPAAADEAEAHGGWRRVLPLMPALVIGTGFFALFDTIAAGVVVLLLPLLPWAISSRWLCWPLLFVLGAAAGSIYTLSLVACGERFRGVALVVG